MSTETKHTPLPWTIHPLSKRKVCAGPDGGKQTIAACGRQGELPPRIYDELCANAAFIVHACNAHQDLVDALIEAAFAIPTTHSAFKTVQAALAKALGSSSGEK